MLPATNTAWGENAALSYRNLRAIIGYIALTLPLVLVISGVVDGHFEGSMSAYYYTNVGDVFTGALCVIGIFLVAYRLAAWTLDNIATTLAGIAALGVAFFHSAPAHATLSQLRLADVHLSCATALLVLLGAISLFIFPRTDIELEQKWHAACYMGLGALIWLSVILMPVLNAVASSFYNDYDIFFALEAICVVAFALSFILKGHGQPTNRKFAMEANQPPPGLTRPQADRDAAPTETPPQPTVPA